MSAFQIFDNLGCPRIAKGHPVSQIVAIESGCFFLLNDIANDKKIKMHRHDSQIQEIILSENYVFSVDSGPKISVLVSEVSTLKRVFQFYLPIQKSRGVKPAHSVKLAYSEKFQKIIIAESEFQGGFRLSGWDFRAEKTIKLFFIADIDTNERCSDVMIMESRNEMLAVTSEQSVIKYWKVGEKQAILTNRIHIKEEISNIQIETSNNIVLVLTKTGKIVLLNDSGDYLDIIRGEKPYTAMATYQNFCFFGTCWGTIQIYDMKRVQRVNEIPFATEYREIFSLNKNQENDEDNDDELDDQSHQGNESSYYSNSSKIIEPQFKRVPGTYLRNIQKGSPVATLTILNEGNMLGITHSDGMFLVYDIASGEMRAHQIGHFGKINQITWDEDKISRFFSAGNDGYFAVWNLYNDRWIAKIFDIHKTLDSDIKSNARNLVSKKNEFISLTGAFQIKGGQPSKSKRIKLTCFTINYEYQEIYVGDNKGCITVLDLENIQLVAKFKVCSFKIKKMSISPQSGHLALSLATGMSLLLDVNRQFQMSLKIEDHFVTPSPLISKNAQFKAIFCLRDSVSDNFNKSKIPSKLSNDIQIESNSGKKPPNLFSSNAQMRLATSTYFNEVTSSSKKNDPNSFLIVASHSSNSMRLHSIQINILDDSVTGIALMIYQTEGRISGCDLHPSKEYILILDDIGLCYLYKIKSGELRGRIELPQHSTSLTIDSSGLYFAVCAYQADNIDDEGAEEEDEDNPSKERVEEILLAKSLQLRDLSKSRDPLSINKEIQRDSQIFMKNSMKIQQNIPVTSPTSQSSKTLYEVVQFLQPQTKAIWPKMVLLYELGTGKQVGIIQKLFDTSGLSFSSNSEYLSVYSQRGIVSIWATEEEIFENVTELLRSVEIEPTFWTNFPLYIKKNLIDVRQLKQNLKNIVNLEYHQEQRESEIQKARTKQSVSQNFKGGISNFYSKTKGRDTKSEINNSDILHNLSHINKEDTNKETAGSRRIQNFERAYQNIEGHELKGIPKSSSNIFFQPNNKDDSLESLNNKFDRDRAMKIFPDIQRSPVHKLDQLGQFNFKSMRQMRENPADIDEDVDNVVNYKSVGIKSALTKNK